MTSNFSKLIDVVSQPTLTAIDESLRNMHARHYSTLRNVHYRKRRRRRNSLWHYRCHRKTRVPKVI